MIGPTPLFTAVRGEQAAQVWARLRERHLRRVEVLERAVLALMDGELDEELRELAESEAHSLAGTVGSFGMRGGSRLARALEQSFSSRHTLARPLAMRLADQVLALRRELERPGATLAVAADGTLPARILLLGSAERCDQFVAEGVSMGLEVTARALGDGAHAIAEEAPEAIILEGNDDEPDALIALLDSLGTRLAVPAFVVTARDTMAMRLAIARAGASGPLLPGQPPAMILERAATAIAARELGQPSILLVDGDPYALQVTTLILEQGGMRVLPLGDPMAFWETLESVQPDAVVTAATMAVTTAVNGVDLCRALRADPRWRELPVILLATADEAPFVREAYLAGTDDVVRKPVQPLELVPRVQNRLRRSRQARRPHEVNAVTGLAGRRKAERDLDRFLQLARRHRHEVTLITMRLDGYAEAVQRLGQSAVDAASLAVSQLLQQSFRAEDVVSQWGPNQYVIGLFDANAANAATRVREIMAALRARRFPAPSGATLAFTCSAGIATFPDDAGDVRSLHDAADAALLSSGGASSTEVLGVASNPHERATGRIDVLLVEDDAAVATLLVHALQSRQYEVRWLRSGQEAASALLGEPPEIRARLILMEVNLPELDGLALLRSLGEQDVLRHTRVIVLSSRSTEAETVQAFELGAFDYVPKPFSVPVLAERIRRAMRA
ncbi:MAG: response regulator [Gemmatimonadaceae bacterium]|nr:response regulator [Gemmatimonadaceae bacterium]